MLLKYVETLQNTLAKQKSIDFCFVLYNFYVVKGNKKKCEHIAFDTFRHIKEQSNNRGDNGFWSDGSALLFVLENLDKNGFIETDLGSVLQDYDTWLIAQISRQRMDFKQRDLSFYIQLLFDRRRHLNINVAPVNKAFLAQIAEKIVQYIDTPTISLHQVAIHRDIIVLLNLNQKRVYREILEKALRRLAVRLETGYAEGDNTVVFLNNLTIYPIICQFISLKPRLDIVAVISDWLGHAKLSDDDTLHWTDRYYLLNSLIRVNTELANHIWNEELEDILTKEAQAALNQDSQQKYLLALTINSYLHPNLSSWDEVLLVPRFSSL